MKRPTEDIPLDLELKYADVMRECNFFFQKDPKVHAKVYGPILANFSEKYESCTSLCCIDVMNSSKVSAFRIRSECPEKYGLPPGNATFSYNPR